MYDFILVINRPYLALLLR